MANFIKILGFALITVSLFAGFSNIGIPQIQPAPPPTDEKIDLSSMTMEQFITLGETIFSGKGTCTLCHNELGRAPMLGNLVADSSDHLQDQRYQGEATSVEEFIFESMLKPSAFVVSGFGKAGTKDTESPMPDVSSGAIGLTDAEQSAVVAYLQDLGGVEVTVVIPKASSDSTDGLLTESNKNNSKTADVAQRAIYANAGEIIEKFNCGMCHKVEDRVGTLGPDLTSIGSKYKRDYLRRAIIDPGADIAEGFPPIMPPGYGDQLYAGEMEMLVSYLLDQK